MIVSPVVKLGHQSVAQLHSLHGRHESMMADLDVRYRRHCRAASAFHTQILERNTHT